MASEKVGTIKATEIDSVEEMKAGILVIRTLRDRTKDSRVVNLVFVDTDILSIFAKMQRSSLVLNQQVTSYDESEWETTDYVYVSSSDTDESTILSCLLEYTKTPNSLKLERKPPMITRMHSGQFVFLSRAIAN